MSSLVEIYRRFPDRGAAIAHLEKVRWNDFPECAYCGWIGVSRNRDAKREATAERWKCQKCLRSFSVTVGTIFHNSHVDLQRWFLLISLMLNAKKGLSAMQAARDLDMRRPTVWSMMHRIRKALVDDGKLLSGLVEMDEAYVGGKPRKRNRRDDDIDAPRGRGTKKTPVVSLVQRGGRVRSFTVKDAKASTLRKILKANVDPSATLMTDEWRPYISVGKEFRRHERVSHGKGEYARRDGAHVNSAEGYFSLFKRGLVGTFHHVGHHYLDQYLAEFDFRYSHRDVSDGARTIAGLKKVEGKRLTLHRPQQAAN